MSAPHRDTTAFDASEFDTTAGRPIRLAPTAPGFWLITLGVCLAGLAPLFGFLVGVTSGRPEGEVIFSPLYWGLFAGVIIGGFGVLMAVLGGVRLWRHNQARQLPGREASAGAAS